MPYVLITGANRGIGLELVRQCLERGDTVFAACRNPAGTGALQRLVDRYPERLHILQMDVSDADTIRDASRAIAAYADRLDLVFNNAAVNYGDETIVELDPGRVLETLQINAIGPLLVVQGVLDFIKNGQEPRVVNISSESGSIERLDRFRGYSYGGSKTALNMFTRAMAFDPHLEGIPVIALHPGWVQTDMGGENATFTSAESVRFILDITNRLTPAESGKFYDFNGQEYPW